MNDYKDPNDPGNGNGYHTGLSCINNNCDEPAGTLWSPYWCVKHNIQRMDMITMQILQIVDEVEDDRL